MKTFCIHLPLLCITSLFTAISSFAHMLLSLLFLLPVSCVLPPHAIFTTIATVRMKILKTLMWTWNPNGNHSNIDYRKLILRFCLICCDTELQLGFNVVFYMDFRDVFMWESIQVHLGLQQDFIPTRISFNFLSNLNRITLGLEIENNLCKVFYQIKCVEIICAFTQLALLSMWLCQLLDIFHKTIKHLLAPFNSKNFDK